MPQKTSQSASLAKITRPRPEQVLARARLLQRLDRARKISWVVAPPGAGKTTLVADYIARRKPACLWYQIDEGDADIAAFFHYLGMAVKKAAPRKRRPLPHFTPEYRAGLATFTRRYFQELYSRLKPPFTLVFDNYQEVAADAGLHEVLRDGLDGLPAGGHVVVLSRSAPPPAFARFLASGAMDILDWDALKLTLGEFSSIVRLRGRNRLPAEMLQQLYARTQGWVAGLVLILERTEHSRPQAELESTPQAIFDYFAGEVFDKSDHKTREVLLQTAFLPMLNVKTVEQLTGQNRAGRILSDLSRKNYFTVKHPQAEPVYQYHPLFQEFLRARAKEMLLPERLTALQQNAAALLETDGQVEAAAELLRAAQDWAMLARLIGRHASLFISQGRTQTIEGWLCGIPEELRARDPWLEYWLGACRLAFDPPESQRCFERAFRLFQGGKNPAGLFLSWSGVMDAIIYGWNEFAQADYWIGMLDELLREYAAPPSADIEARITVSVFFVLSLRQPQHPQIPMWLDRAHAVAQRSLDIRAKSFIYGYLEFYYLCVGDHAGAESIVAALQKSTSSADAPPLARITGKAVEAVYQVRMARHDLCLKAVAEGLEIAHNTGVLVWNSQLFSQGANNALSAGDAAGGEMYLEKMASTLVESRRIDVCMYHYNTAWAAMLQEDPARAQRHVDLALRFAQEAGAPFHQGLCHLALALVLHQRGERQPVAPHLAEARRVAVAMHSRILEFMCLLAQAEFAFDTDDERVGLTSLAAGLALGKEQSYVNFYWWRPKAMSRLCAKALEAGLEMDYVQGLIRRRKLTPAPDFLYSNQWPWAIKIHALGRFSIIKEGRPIQSGVKAQRKPLDLLQTLIALGGRDVPEAQLSDILWPDAAGDAAHRAFLTTLQRLRRLLGYKEALVSADGRLTLDPRHAWVDVSAFERLLNQAETAEHERQGEAACDLRIKALSLYRGHFSGQDTAPAISMRERLRDKYLRHCEALGRHWEQIGNWARALECYLKALEVDDLAEVFYQRLMVGYQKLDRRAEALAVYERCAKTLAAALGIKPSAATQALYRALTGR